MWASNATSLNPCPQVGLSQCSEGLLAKAARTAYANPHTRAMPCDNLPVLGVATDITRKRTHGFIKIRVRFASVTVFPLLQCALR